MIQNPLNSVDWVAGETIGRDTTEPHHPQHNSAEKRVVNVGTITIKVMSAFVVPMRHHDWCQKYCCDCHNILESIQLNWSSPTERETGNTPYISHFRFHFWEPIWVFHPEKSPTNYKLWCDTHFRTALVSWDRRSIRGRSICSSKSTWTRQGM